MSEDAYGRLGERLRRILVMLPYAIAHPGVSVDELARKFGVGDSRRIVEDLNLVFLCGLPGYGPGDLIDVTLEEDRVFVRMADYFSAPLRLSPAEALVLGAGAAALADLPGLEGADALRRALDKLKRAIGGPGVQVRLEEAPSAHLETLNRALEESRRVEIEYFSASRGKLTRRAVDPWRLIVSLGRWYLVGLDHLSDEERMFRVDRIKSIDILDARAPVPDDFDPESYRGAYRESAGIRVAFEISPDVAAWFADYYPLVSRTDLADGWQRVELTASSPRWAAGVALRLGRGIRAIEPSEVTEETRSLAHTIAARYRA